MNKLIDENVLEEIDELLMRLTDLLEEDLAAARDAQDEGWAEEPAAELARIRKVQKLLKNAPSV